MLSITLGIICSLLFFTYKPLFKSLKESKFAYKAFIEIIKRDARKAEFKAFARSQLDKVRQWIQKCIDLLSKNPQMQEQTQQESLQANETTKDTKDNVVIAQEIQQEQKAQETQKNQEIQQTQESESESTQKDK